VIYVGVLRAADGADAVCRQGVELSIKSVVNRNDVHR
jgi:hypothetical protein